MATLAAFYTGELGQPKRRAVVEVFGAHNDEGDARFIRQLLVRERSKTP